jgi:hypothetical protein
VEIRLAGWDLPYPGLYHDPEDGVLYLGVIYARAVYRLPYRRAAELGSAQGGQRATELAEGRPRRPEDYRTFHNATPPSGRPTIIV